MAGLGGYVKYNRWYVMVQHPSGQPACIGVFPATSKDRWCAEWTEEEPAQRLQ